jgi:glycosyltransferase involved in cell wall biosynthesis
METSKARKGENPGPVMRVIFINRYFYPDHSATSEILSELSFALAAQMPVKVITGRQNYDAPEASLPQRERLNNVDVWRVWSTRRGRQQLIGRSLDYFTFYFAAAWQLWRIARANDIVVAKTDPPLLCVIIAPIVWLKRAHLVNWLQDIFPEVAETLDVGGGLGRFVFKVLRRLRNWSLHSADINVAVGQGMRTYLRALGIPSEQIKVIPNWSDGVLIAPTQGANELRDQWLPRSCFIVGYAGNLGRVHELRTIIDAMALLRERSEVAFLFVGGGAQRDTLEREVHQRKLTNVHFKPYQPRARLGETLAVADVQLVSLKPELENFVVPSKFYGVAAAGRPTIFIGASTGEIARLLDECACGFTVTPGDARALADRIRQLATDRELCKVMGGRARAAFDKHWNKDQAVAAWEKLLYSIESKPSESK